MEWVQAPVGASRGQGNRRRDPGTRRTRGAPVQAGLMQIRQDATPRAAQLRTHGSWAMRGSFFWGVKAPKSLCCRDPPWALSDRGCAHPVHGQLP